MTDKMPETIWARKADPQFNLWSIHEGEKGKRTQYTRTDTLTAKLEKLKKEHRPEDEYAATHYIEAWNAAIDAAINLIKES